MRALVHDANSVDVNIGSRNLKSEASRLPGMKKWDLNTQHQTAHSRFVFHILHFQTEKKEFNVVPQDTNDHRTHEHGRPRLQLWYKLSLIAF